MAIEPVYRERCLYNDNGDLLAKSIAPITPSSSEYVLYKGHRYMCGIYPTEIILPTLPLTVHKLRFWRRPTRCTLFRFLPEYIKQGYSNKMKLYLSDVDLDEWGDLGHPGARKDRGRFVYVQHTQVHVYYSGEIHILCEWEDDFPLPADHGFDK